MAEPKLKRGALDTVVALAPTLALWLLSQLAGKHPNVKDALQAGALAWVVAAAIIVALRSQYFKRHVKWGRHAPVIPKRPPDDEVKFSIHLDSAKADYFYPANNPAHPHRDYHFFFDIENTASVPINLELSESSVWINGHGPISEHQVPVPHVLAAGKKIFFPLTKVLGLSQSDLATGARCNATFRYHRASGGPSFRCIIDIVAMPQAHDSQGWPSNWNYSFVNPIQHVEDD
jgi:hypothetical protein